MMWLPVIVLVRDPDIRSRDFWFLGGGLPFTQESSGAPLLRSSENPRVFHLSVSIGERG
jgi:hypothetical protein